MTARDQLANLIENVLAERVSAAEAVAAAEGFPDSAWGDHLLAEACHMLIHYREDADIRERDPGYATWQREGLARLVRRLRSGDAS